MAWQTLRHTGKTFAAKDRLPGDSPLCRHRVCPRFIRYGDASRRIAGEYRHTFRHGGCSPPRFSFLPPDRARQFHHRLAASRAGIPPERFFPDGNRCGSSFICLRPVLHSGRVYAPKRPGRTFRVFPEPAGFQANAPFHLFRPGQRPLVATKDKSPFFIPSMKRHAPGKDTFPYTDGMAFPKTGQYKEIV